jgi:TRAP-type mannitol/chloroaromatic compound transport system permease large subunit
MLAILIFLGVFVDQVSMMLITLPIFMPIVQQLGIDPVWFGIMFLTAAAWSAVPPHGLLLMTMRGVAPPEATMMYIFSAVTPFLLLSIGVLALVFVLPGTAT